MRRWQDVRRLTGQCLREVAADRPFSRPVDHVLLLALLAPSALDSKVPAAPAVWLTACLVVAVAVAVRRAAPLTSLSLAALLALSLPWLGASAWPAVAAAVLSWGAGRRLPRICPAQAVFAGATVAGVVLVGALAEAKDVVSLLMLQFASCVLPWWAGNWRRQRAALAHAGWEHAERLEWRQRYVAEQARHKERARIAQDIHDSLGHELSVMALLAGGLELSRELSGEHRAAAGQLRERCTLATERLHEAIGLLREDTGPSLVPAHESIAQLVRRFDGAATPVDFREEGAAPESGVPGLAGLAAYRVVQEALTNSAKHAPGAPVSVRVVHRPDETVVSVANERPRNGESPSVTGSGAGLIGLDERVRLAGGTLRAGPCGGGFEVHARLPHTPGTATPRAPVPAGYDAVDPPGPAPTRRLPDPGPTDDARTDEVAGTSPAEHARAAAPPGRSTSRAALLRTRARLRGDARRAALVPVLLGAAIAAFLTGLYVATSETTSVTPADYGRIRVGETRAELDAVLPSRRIGKPPPALTEPAAPPGAACEYYRASEGLLDFTGTMYRLCFTDDVLTAKDRL